MQRLIYQKQESISGAILLCIGIVAVFSLTVRFLGDLRLFYTHQNQQARHTGLLWGTIAEAAPQSKTKQEIRFSRRGKA